MTWHIHDADGREYWTAEQCSRHCGISRSTWTSYVSRGFAPAVAGHLNARTPLWDAQAVSAWHAGRPSAD